MPSSDEEGGTHRGSPKRNMSFGGSRDCVTEGEILRSRCFSLLNYIQNLADIHHMIIVLEIVLKGLCVDKTVFFDCIGIELFKR